MLDVPLCLFTKITDNVLALVCHRLTYCMSEIIFSFPRLIVKTDHFTEKASELLVPANRAHILKKCFLDSVLKITATQRAAEYVS